jgi:beta-aspartyl-peptidase (threonine type)
MCDVSRTLIRNTQYAISLPVEVFVQPVILVHGGAGAWDLESDRLKEGIAACEAAATAGQAVLLWGGSALDAVEAAVRILEDVPCLDAGRGSYLNAAGYVEMDALIMDGRNLDMGAVAAVQRIQNPISLARRVMSDSGHTFLVGAGAEAFAEQVGMSFCGLEDLLTGEDLAIYLGNVNGKQQTAAETIAGPAGDTVGAVAIDAAGDVAAATSTGGTRQKMPGRVGDSPLVGSGAYADNWTAAVSATGYGEALMKVVISKRVCDFVANGLSAQAACEAALRVLAERVNGTGGLIAIDGRGQVGVAYSTVAMPHAYAVGEEGVQSGR